MFNWIKEWLWILFNH